MMVAQATLEAEAGRSLSSRGTRAFSFLFFEACLKKEKKSDYHCFAIVRESGMMCLGLENAGFYFCWLLETEGLGK